MKKIFVIILALMISMVAFAGCGGQQTESSDSASSVASADDHGHKVLKVGATPVPHAEILEQAKPILAKEGIDLKIVEFTDFVQPNLALNDKELDANYYQHQPFLDNFLAEHPDMNLVNIGGVHIEPLAIYSHKVKDLSELKDGDTISLPNDAVNAGRSLYLAQQAGLIKLNASVSVNNATVQDIIDNPKHIKFKEVDAAQVSRTLDDVAAAIINTNFALEAGMFPPKDALVIESKENTKTVADSVVIRAGDENRPEIQALMKVLHSDAIRQFIEEKYKGAIEPAF